METVIQFPPAGKSTALMVVVVNPVLDEEKELERTRVQYTEMLCCCVHTGGTLAYNDPIHSR